MASMKAFRQLGFLKLHLRSDPSSEEEERVLNLFRNRAELKKAHGELQKEVYRLRDRIKQQEGATQRAQDMLAALEGRLAFPETGYPALVFYQLRRLWQAGRELIEQLIADLARRQDQRERQQHFAEHHRRQTARLQTADQQVREAENQVAAARSVVTELEAQRAALNKLLHYFKRRGLAQQIVAAQGQAAGAEAGLKEARSVVESIQKEPVPEFPGLSIDARRAINLAAIAYADALCLRLAGTRLVRLAREATTHREVTDEYGSRKDCEMLMEQVDRALTTISQRGTVAQEIKVRTDRLRAQVRYRNPADTAPMPESLNPGGGDSQASEGALTVAGNEIPNVLAEDVWDLYKVLLR
jgi:DNA repair exonuclease SbcCD ATPase subunit